MNNLDLLLYALTNVNFEDIASLHHDEQHLFVEHLEFLQDQLRKQLFENGQQG